jgi:TM2 domain-containing membrane protein YozV
MMKDRSIAIILCFFTGFFGIHKFYLGKITDGVVYLIFGATGIPAIFAFFDFFGLCFMSDREFNARFNHSYHNVIDPISSHSIAAQPKSIEHSTAALYDLKRLYDDEIITAEEYEMKRRKVLEDI